MSIKINLSGQKFNRLKVIDFNEEISKERRRSFWNCLCDCGNKTIVQSTPLQRGDTKSCGCLQRECGFKKRLNLKGQKYNRLTAIEFSYIKNKKTFWKCICDCGNEIIISLGELRSGNTKSCGCLRIELDKIPKYFLPNGEASFNQLYNNYQKRAQKSNFIFTLNKQQFKLLTSSNCKYCDSEPKQKLGLNRIHGHYIYNGIDRIENNKGYTIENSVSCCKICNFMKHILTEEEFFEHIKKIIIHSGII